MKISADEVLDPQATILATADQNVKKFLGRPIATPLDTPLGNAESEYRPRTLQALKNVDLDQVIILTHDEEVTPVLAETIKSATSQTFLVEFQGRATGSVVQPDTYFER